MRTLFRFLKALFKYAVHGHFKNVEFADYAKRLMTCSKCDKADTEKWRCGVCGCYLTKKAKWKTENCPMGKWSGIE